jgi:hypothetical protein
MTQMQRQKPVSAALSVMTEWIPDEIAEDVEKGLGFRAMHALRRRPLVGVTLFGTLGIAAATVIGPGELAVGIALGLAAYKVLRRGETAEQALDDVEHDLR